MLGKEQLKELARQYLEGEITGEEFFMGLVSLMETEAWTEECTKWLTEQILIAR